MKNNIKYEYDLVNSVGVIGVGFETREEARTEKREFKDAGINSKIIQKKYQLIEIKEVR